MTNLTDKQLSSMSVHLIGVYTKNLRWLMLFNNIKQNSKPLGLSSLIARKKLTFALLDLRKYIISGYYV